MITSDFASLPFKFNRRQMPLGESQMVFRMTKRMRDWLYVISSEIDINNRVQSWSIKEWYCNLILINRRKYLLFTNTVTLFSFIVPEVRRQDVRDVGELFRTHAVPALEAEGITLTQLRYLIDSGPDQILKTTSRAVLGSMTDFVHMYKYRAELLKEEGQTDRTELNRSMNDAPMSYLGMENATAALKNHLKSVGVE